MQVKPSVVRLMQNVGIPEAQVDLFRTLPLNAAVALVRALPADSPLKAFEEMLVESMGATPAAKEAPAEPKAWMVKANGKFERVTDPPLLGTTTYTGPFNKAVIPGGDDGYGGQNSDRVVWTPMGPLEEHAYDGAGDRSMTRFEDPNQGMPKSFMVKHDPTRFTEVTTPPPPGTEVYVGTFQRKVRPGYVDQYNERVPDSTLWIPAKDVKAVVFAGAVTDTF